MRRLRDSVFRDLAWLLNCHEPRIDRGLTRIRKCRRSVLNFGMPSLAGGR